MSIDKTIERSVLSAASANDLTSYYIVNHGLGAFLYLGIDKHPGDSRYAWIKQGDCDLSLERFHWKITQHGYKSFSIVNYSNDSNGGLFESSDFLVDEFANRIVGTYNYITSGVDDRYIFTTENVSDNSNIVYLQTSSKRYIGASKKADGLDHQVMALFDKDKPGASDYNYLWYFVPIPVFT
ncbi:hypothetical protein [Photorhabdus sp. CRCIA-P01]|uniref:hypothetical protein n=1 Tax=Photorhabdus sp. CRCIA-P01 TaxID=2019570 RepID=UPI000E59DD2B|nr:hypothetical protein [Photorhabdus sp. CRCIA-P01]